MPVNHEIEKAASQFDKNVKVVSQYYTHGQPGTEPVLVKQEETHYAKMIDNITANRTEYYIKLNAYHRFYDPFVISFQRHNSQDRQDERFRKVNKECFLTYLEYLKTRRFPILSLAERLSDG